MRIFLNSAKYEFGERLPSSIRLWRYTLYSALLKIKLRNANSKLGLLWEPISTFLVSAVLAVVWVKVLGVSDNEGYLMYVYFGMVVWAAIASSISNLCATLLKNSSKMVTKPVSMYSYIFEDMLLSFLPFLMSLPLIIVILFTVGSGVHLSNFPYLIFGIVNLLVAGFGFAISVGTLSFLVGDVRQLITSLMRLGFLITPVIWTADRLGSYEKYLILNPFYGYLHVIRQALIGGEVKLSYLLQSIVLTLVLVVVGFVMVASFSMKIQERALKS